MLETVEELSEMLYEAGYFIDPTMTKVVFLADQMKKPLLLEGPAGSGKTLVARSLAESMQCNFQQLSIADFKQQQLGASGQRVREVWNQARNNQPAVIFLDECEGILGRRGAAETDVVSADIVQAFLAEWGRCRSTSPRLGDWRYQPPRHAG